MTENNRTTRLLGVTEVTQLTGLDARTVTRRAAAGELPFVQKLNGPRGAYIFDQAVIVDIAEKLAEEHEQKAAGIRTALAEMRAAA